MRQLQPVVWSKGVFLSPQHLQAQDRFFEETLRFLSGALSFRNWGLSTIQIDAAGLAEGRLSVTQASGVFPDGLMLDMPASDALPRSRNLEECFHDNRQTCAFYLAIPQDRPGGINIGLQRGGVSTRFYAELQMLRDENSSGVEKPVSLARKNLQILAEGENLEGSVLLPFAQIERTEAGGYRLDAKFVPPMLNLKSSELLSGILRGEIETLVARSSQLAGSRRQRNQSLADFTASDIANFWLLYTINSQLPVLRHMLEADQVHPEALFLEMLSLAGALTTFSTKIEPRDLLRLKFLKQLLHRHHHEEVNGRRDDDELNDRVNKVSVSNFAAIDGRHQIRKVRLPHNGRYQRVDDVADQRIDDVGKCRANDDRNGQIDDIAAQNKITKAFQHRYAPHN